VRYLGSIRVHSRRPIRSRRSRSRNSALYPSRGRGWLTCGLGAASHIGNRPIAEYLISQGAPPSLFSAACSVNLRWSRPSWLPCPGSSACVGRTASACSHTREWGAKQRVRIRFPAIFRRRRCGRPDFSVRGSGRCARGNIRVWRGVTQQVDLTADTKLTRLSLDRIR
jgi:hypothetical protein